MAAETVLQGCNGLHYTDASCLGDLGVNRDDNVFRTQTNEKSTALFTIAPAVDLKSQWSRHLLELVAGSKSYLFSSHGSENLTDWNVGGNGRLDIQRGSAVYAGGSYSKLHEISNSPDSPGFIGEPVQYRYANSQVSVTVQTLPAPTSAPIWTGMCWRSSLST